MDRICRVLVGRDNTRSPCIIGQEAQNIVAAWFKTRNDQFGGKTPEDCIDYDFEKLLDYIAYLDTNFMHDEMMSPT